jgi:putative phosphoribosyl transferase
VDRLFRNRQDAGARVAALLLAYQADNPLVLAMTPGAVPVAFEVARRLGAELDVWLTLELVGPLLPEFAVGGVAEGGSVVLDHTVTWISGIAYEELGALRKEKPAEVEARGKALRRGRDCPSVLDRTVIVVSEGSGTPHAASSALRAIRARRPKRLVYAAPVASAEAMAALSKDADVVVCVASVPNLYVISPAYDELPPVSDAECAALLDERPSAQLGR